jgi:hypothetical protein
VPTIDRHRRAVSRCRRSDSRRSRAQITLPARGDHRGQEGLRRGWRLGCDPGPYQFQWWALGLVGARPVEQKKGADKGIDGRLFFHDEATGGKTKQIIFSVKAGKTSVAHVRDLRGVIDREDAEIGVLITMKQPTKDMRAEAASAGHYRSPGWQKDYPRLQLITVAELLDGKTVQFPPGELLTFKGAERADEQHTTESLFDG